MIVFKIRVDDQGTLILDKVGKKAQALEIQLGKTSGLISKAFHGVAMYAGISAFIQSMGNANKEANEFYLNIKRIEQVGGLTGKGLGQVSDQMRKLAVNTEYSQSQISAAGVTLSRMGINTAETLGKILPNAMDLATVAGEELQYTAQGLAQIFNIFGINNENATTATNKIGVALNATALDLKGYIEAMQYAGGAAKATGVSFDDVTAAIAYLSQTAINGSRAGTTMKNILISLVEPASEAGKALASSSLAANDLVGMFKLLADKGVGVDKIVKMFGQWAAPGALNLQAGIVSFTELREKIRGATSDVHSQATEIRTSATPAYKMMIQSITELGMIFGEALGLKQGDLWRKLRLEILSLAEYVKANKDEFKQLGDNLKWIAKAIIDLGSSGLKSIISHFREFGIILAGFWIGGKLASIPDNIGKMNLSMSNLGNAANLVQQGISSWLGPLQSAVILLTSAASLYDYLEERKDEEEKSKDSALNRAQGTKEYIAELKELLRLRDHALVETRMGYPNGVGNKDYKKAVKDMVSKYGNLEELQSRDTLVKYIGAQEKKYAVKNFMGPPRPGEGQWGTRGTTTTTGGLPTILPDSDTLTKAFEKAVRMLGGETTSVLSKKQVESFKTSTGITLPIINQSKVTGAPKGTGVYWSDLNSESDLIPGVGSYDIPSASSLGGPKSSASSKANDDLLAKLDKFWGKKDKLEEMDWNKSQAMYAALGAAASESASFIIELENRKHEQIMRNLETEQNTIDSKYQKEIAAAGNNTFKRTMIEQKYAAQKIALENKIEARKKEIAKNELLMAKIQAGITLALTVLGVMKSSAWAGPIAVITSIATILAAGLPFVQAITTKNYREGSKGVITGNGNATSDSEWARVSRGERVLSVAELSKLGGNERIQQILDRNSASLNRNISINIGTVYGSKVFVRELISTMKEELSR